MELDVLQLLIGFVVGLVFGIAVVLIVNKVRSGSASPAGVKQECDEYKNQVEEHFEQTSRKFQNMTEQYQDLYQHLSVGATSLCRPDSVAAALVDSSESLKIEQIEANQETSTGTEEQSEEPLEEKVDDSVDTAESPAVEIAVSEDSKTENAEASVADAQDSDQSAKESEAAEK